LTLARDQSQLIAAPQIMFAPGDNTKLSRLR
jgi:hypothetical protein